MSVNFDAKLTLDISAFMRNLKTAENSFDQFASKVTNKKLKVEATVATDSMDKRRQEANALKQRNDHEGDHLRNLARERYALYDVAEAYQIVATAAFGALNAMGSTAIQFERSFANVDRTTEFTSAKIGEAARVMKYELKQIASEIPVAFGQITEIATIGNQLGIAQGRLESFTKTVAMFSATTGMTTEASAMGLGRVVELLSDSNVQVGYEQLAASIAYAGVKAVATEEQIVSTTKEIATTGKMAKFSAPEVVGLATALASVGVAPEAARGSIIRAFAGINKAISEGGAALNQYANISGMSAKEFSSQWTTNGQVAFDAFLSGLQSLSAGGQNLDTVLRGLGMVNVRDIQTIQKLGDNYDVYAESIRNANQAYSEGTFLGEAYGKIQETVAAKIALLQNNWTNLLDTLGQGAVGDTFKLLLDVVNDVLVQLNNFARTPIAQALGPIVMASLALVGAIAGLNAIVALAQASIRAYAVAMGVATVQTTVLANGMTAASLSLNKGAVALKALEVARNVVGPLMKLTLVLGMVAKASEALAPIEQRAENLLGGFGGLQEALTQDLAAYNAALAETGSEEAARDTAQIYGEVAAASNNADEETARLAANTKLLADMFDISSTSATESSTSIDDLTVRIGANTAAWIKNAIVQSDTFQKLITNDDAMNALAQSGFNLNAALEAQANGTLDEYMDGVTDAAVGAASGFEQWTYSMYDSENVILQMLSIVPRLLNELLGFLGIDLFPVANAMQATETSIKGAWTQAGLLGPELTKAGSAADAMSGEFGDLNEELNNTSKQIRTVVDYANDLSGVLSRTTELTFGDQIGQDAIASAWKKIGESAADAAEEIKKANAEVTSLKADRGILEYQLSVAERYGDEVRAAKLRAQLAKNQDDITEAEAKSTRAAEAQNKSLTDGSDAALQNRASLLTMVGTYEDYITMMAKLGKKPAELATKIKGLKAEFQKNALAAGFAKDEIADYLELFDGFGTVAKDTPRDVDIEVKLGITAAQQAIDEFIAKLTALNGSSYSPKVDVKPKFDDKSLAFGFSTWDLEVDKWANRLKPAIKPKLDGTSFKNGSPEVKAAEGWLETFIKDMNKKSISIKMAIDKNATLKGFLDTTFNIAGLFAKASPIRAFWEGINSAIKGVLGFASGGYVSGPGTGTSDSIPARLSNGEFVMQASAVNAYGVDFMNSLNQQKVGVSSAGAGISTVSSGTTVAYLSPEDRALLRAAIDRPINLYSDNVKIAEAANSGNTMIARRGTR